MAKRVIVGVDVRDLRIATTGTRTYLEELCMQFRRLNGHEIQFVFFDTFFPVYTGKNKLLKLTEHIRYQFWKQLALPLKAWWFRCDIVFCTDYYVPLLQIGYRTIPVFHDAFFFEYPEHYNSIWVTLFKGLAVPAAKKSAAVIVPSFYARDRVAYYTGIETGKLRVVYEAPKSLAKNPVPQHPLIGELIKGREHGLQYLLHIGSFDKRKNLPMLVDAFARLVQNGYGHLRLILAGKSSPKQFSEGHQEVHQRIIFHDLKDEVFMPGYIADGDLPWLYENASLYIFPSLNEGFGLPVVESFLMKLPVIAANNTCLPEIGGDAIMGFDPKNVDDLCSCIKTLLDDEALRHQLVKKGLERLKFYSWEKAAQQTIVIFKELAAHRRTS